MCSSPITELEAEEGAAEPAVGVAVEVGGPDGGSGGPVLPEGRPQLPAPAADGNAAADEHAGTAANPEQAALGAYIASSQEGGFSGLSLGDDPLSGADGMVEVVEKDHCGLPGRRKDGQVGVPGRECNVCMIRNVQVALIPCGHACMCRRCSRRLSRCPVCRKEILRRQRLYI